MPSHQCHAADRRACIEHGALTRTCRKDCFDCWRTESIGRLRLSLARGTSPGPAYSSHLVAASASAEEPIAAIGLEAGHAGAGRQLEPLQNLARSRIDSSHVAVVTFPGSVPELAVDPGDAGHDAIGLDGSKN